MRITWDALILESLPAGSSFVPTSHMPPLRQDRKSNEHCKMLSMILATGRVSFDRKHLQRYNQLRIKKKNGENRYATISLYMYISHTRIKLNSCIRRWKTQINQQRNNRGEQRQLQYIISHKLIKSS